ncbi:MAG: metal-dependent transcriptional regulator [Planctomycetota bacterium]|nr:metal-dependent transcriptional regulator [Planctomycetota bacterium]
MTQSARKTERPAHGNGLRPRSLSANMEDYLEAIFRLAEREGACRVSQIAEKLGVKRPSVSKALKRLKEQGLVVHTPYGGVGVTARGKQVALQQVRTHRVLTNFLTGVLKLPEDLAEHDACLMEHAISHETVERLVEFIDHLKVQDRNGGSSFRKGRAPKDAKGVRRSRRSWTSRV